MYPPKGGAGYGGQQPYGQQSYGQLHGTGFSGNPATGSDIGAQHALASRQSSMMGIGQETDLSSFRSTQAAQYGGPYASVYGSAALGGGQQVGGVNSKVAVSSSLQGRTAYPTLAEPSKYSAGTLGSSFNDDYTSASNRAYAQKGDQFSGAKHSEYAIDRRPYAEHQSAYIGRELQSDPARRYADPSSLSHQTDVHDHMDQASLLRQQQILKAHSLHSGTDIRQAEYLAARAAPIHGSQEYSSYGGRMDVDSHGLPIIGNPPYGAQHSASILGAPRRNAEDLIFAQGSSNAGYAVSLPAGRDYGSGKGLLGPNDSSYQGSILSRGQRDLELATVADLKDDRNALLRELDRRDEEHRRDLLREREKERERERERERDRERERSRLLERRDRERERDQKRGLDSRRERTPPSASRDRRGSSGARDERLRRVSPRRTPPRRISPRRVSPRREIVHRHRSPVKEKKREYVCKVHPFCFVEAERDYLSINKRYPRLSISPEFSKIVLKWPNGNLHLSLHTPVSFEHDFTEDDKSEEAALAPLEDSLKNTNIVWNAKVLLMSGFSSDSLDELCSDRSSDDRLIHFNNILRFAVLKKEHSFMAIGGQWKGTVDGGDLDPSVDSSALIQTAKRYAKDIIQLDLQNCQHWNPFLEIHYNRIGDDGLFSYKEITVLFVPDLSECLPTLDSWRSKWLAHRKEIVERELRLAASKKEKKSSEKESIQGDHGRAKSEKASSTKKIGKGVDQLSKDEKVGKVDEAKDGGGSKKVVSEQKEKLPQLDETPTEVKDVESTEGDKAINKKPQGLHSVDPEGEVKKAAKKKIIRKVVKGKSADKKAAVSTEETVTKAANNVNEKDAKNKPTTQENLVQETDNSAEPVKGKTFVRKRIVRKVAAAKSSQKEDNTVAEKKPEQVIENQEVKANNNKELADAAAQQTSGVKATGKKKIIRRVIKKKVPAPEGNDGVTLAQDGGQAESNTSVQKIEKKNDLTESILPEIKIKEEIKSLSTEQDVKKANEVMDDKKVSRLVGNKVPKVEKRSSSKTSELETLKNKDSEKNSLDAKAGERSRHEKERNKDGNHDSRHKPHKEAKEKGMSEDPPQQPGFFLQTKRTKGSKIRSMSLSLGGLLEYNDKDIEESTFELSLFAESFNEMLQYQMGCRLLSFLEKLRKRFVIKHKQHKRQREEKHEKEREAGKSSAKRLKISENSPAEKEHPKSGTKDIKDQNHDESSSKDGEASEAAEVVEAVKPELEKKSDGDEVKEEDEEEEEKEEEEEEVEDMEEMFEEDDDMEDAAPTIDAVQGADESMAEKTLVEADTKGDAKDDHEKDGSSERSTDETLKKDENSSNGTKDDQLLSSDKPDSVKEVVNKELLQAFRFFDYNKVGYIKIDDLRSILHNLGKFLSHRDVKEMVQSAFYESGSARDSRIFYKKLVRMTGL